MIATATDTYQIEHARFREEQSSTIPTWLRELRERGLNHFTELGIPTTRDEEWRFTNIAPLLKEPFTVADSATPVASQIDELIRQAALDDDFHRLVFVNGRFAEQWSVRHELPPGVVVESLAESIQQSPDEIERRLAGQADFNESAFLSLNTAFIEDGANICVPDGVTIDRPIHLIFLSAAGAPSVSHPRNIVSLGKNSRATVVESYLGVEGPAYFTNAVTEIELGDSADLDHHKLQHEQPNALHVASTHVRQQASSNFRSHYFSFGGDLARNELNCMLDGERIECTLNGLYMPTGDQLMDCRTRIDHLQPHCNSYELYKGILDDRAKGVFNGKIYVHQDAQKTDAKQSNQAILLSNDAVIDTKPQLEIYADDVRCTHGATVGALDEQALYYLRSRGIPADLSRTMLIFAFANDVVQGVEVPAVRRRLESILLAESGLPNV
jgi:Fe-S cluster assembly protein SufD